MSARDLQFNSGSALVTFELVNRIGDLGWFELRIPKPHMRFGRVSVAWMQMFVLAVSHGD